MDRSDALWQAHESLVRHAEAWRAFESEYYAMVPGDDMLSFQKRVHNSVAYKEISECLSKVSDKDCSEILLSILDSNFYRNIMRDVMFDRVVSLITGKIDLAVGQASGGRS